MRIDRFCIGVLAATALTACSTHGPTVQQNEGVFCVAGTSVDELKKVEEHRLAPDKTVSVLQGDFDKVGPLDFIFSFPAHFIFPVHYHDHYEEIIILSGSAYIGGMDGRPLTLANGMLHKPGDRHHLPAKTTHWVFTTDEPVVAKLCTRGKYGLHFTTDERPHKGSPPAM